jgi:TRAP transporter 4TM/12TM fusion protein
MRSPLTARNLFLVVALGNFVTLVQYFFTGAGGPVQLATRLLPVAVVLWALRAYDQGGPYAKLGAGSLANQVVTGAYVLAAAVTFGYFFVEFEDIFLLRQGSYSTTDVWVGALILVVVMEISRKLHLMLFGVNVLLIVYALYGQHSPVDFFWHPGTTPERLVTSSTVELATGVFGRYTQMALTLIAAFLLLAAVARGFEAQTAVIRTIQAAFSRSRRSIPFTAVLASLSIGLVSGSGSANTAVTGSFTIPLMKRHGLPGERAGAIETAASMGGLILPPLMAVAGFIMAEFLGVPYWEVALRGFAIGGVYFATLMLAVYLMSVRWLPPGRVERPVLRAYEYFKTAFFFGAVAALVIMLGVIGIGEYRAALYGSLLLLAALVVLYAVFKYARRDPDYRPQKLLGNFRTMVETHADLTWYLVILLATLGITIGLATVTGFLLRMGQLMLDLTSVSIVATILLAWVFGWLAGTGLPPTATYVIVAVIIAPPLIRAGIDPWVAHFFAFLLAIWGELSPPTSLTAAVAARIAEASFLRTMFEALKICLPVVLMSFAIFVRTEVVVEPGWSQVLGTVLLTVGSLALTFAALGRAAADRWPDAGGRLLVAAVGLVILFHPSTAVAATASVAAAALLVLGVLRSKKLHAPEPEAAPALT